MNIKLRQGDDFSWAAAFRLGADPLDLTGYAVTSNALPSAGGIALMSGYLESDY